MQNQASQSNVQSNSARKSWETPRLVVHGDARALTQQQQRRTQIAPRVRPVSPFNS